MGATLTVAEIASVRARMRKNVREGISWSKENQVRKGGYVKENPFRKSDQAVNAV